jgi:hypothetical protein
VDVDEGGFVRRTGLELGMELDEDKGVAGVEEDGNEEDADEEEEEMRRKRRRRERRVWEGVDMWRRGVSGGVGVGVEHSMVSGDRDDDEFGTEGEWEQEREQERENEEERTRKRAEALRACGLLGQSRLYRGVLGVDAGTEEGVELESADVGDGVGVGVGVGVEEIKCDGSMGRIEEVSLVGFVVVVWGTGVWRTMLMVTFFFVPV